MENVGHEPYLLRFKSSCFTSLQNFETKGELKPGPTSVNGDYRSVAG